MGGREASFRLFSRFTVGQSSLFPCYSRFTVGGEEPGYGPTGRERGRSEG